MNTNIKSYLLGITHIAIVASMLLVLFYVASIAGLLFLTDLTDSDLALVSLSVFLTTMLSMFLIKKHIIVGSTARFMVAASVLPILFNISYALFSYFAHTNWLIIILETIPVAIFIFTTYFLLRLFTKHI